MTPATAKARSPSRAGQVVVGPRYRSDLDRDRLLVDLGRERVGGDRCRRSDHGRIAGGRRDSLHPSMLARSPRGQPFGAHRA